MPSIVEEKAVETIALYVLSNAQRAALLALTPGICSEATWKVLRRLQLLYSTGRLYRTPTPLGDAVRKYLAQCVINEPNHWIRDELYWPRIQPTIEELAR